VNNLSIKQVFLDSGISRNDVIFIHGDAGVAAQLIEVEIKYRFEYLIKNLIDFIGSSGTLVIPTFSYTFTKSQNFDVDNTPSDVGFFSESFRTYSGFCRSKNPNFSVSSFGKYSSEFANSRIDDCFGQNTAFDLLRKYNAKIICLGCEFDRVTFVHYVEQLVGVNYRYFKNFSGEIIYNNKRDKLENTYFVRNLNIASNVELSLLKELAIEKKFLNVERFGRYMVLSINAEDFFQCAVELLNKNPYALIEHRFNEKNNDK
jgi:aminoglycoside 3-N-acetyltransferase